MLQSLDSRADLAQHYLYKVLLKTKSIASSPQLPDSVTVPPRTELNNATANVTARLYNSNPTKEALEEVLSRIRTVLGLEGTEWTTGEKRRGGEQAKSPVLTDDGLKAQRETVAKPGRSQTKVQSASSASDVEEFDGYDGRLASSSSSEDEGAEEPEGVAISEAHVSRKHPVEYKPSASQSPSPEPSPSPELSDSASPPPLRKDPVKQPSSKTTVLPSLTTGGYWSGSESEAEDITDVVEPRKNRRGQRARQAIWEKKYGADAKHMKNPKIDRNSGWDPKYGATAAGGGKPGTPFNRRTSGGQNGAMASGVNDMVIKNPRVLGKTWKRDDEGALHPSWEARKKAKEKDAAQNASFQGTKITFD